MTTLLARRLPLMATRRLLGAVRFVFEFLVLLTAIWSIEALLAGAFYLVAYASVTLPILEVESWQAFGALMFDAPTSVGPVLKAIGQLLGLLLLWPVTWLAIGGLVARRKTSRPTDREPNIDSGPTERIVVDTRNTKTFGQPRGVRDD
jgi:hypothetical protein